MPEDNLEIEVRILEIDKPLMEKRLRAAGFTDHGEDLYNEALFFDKDQTWRSHDNLKVVRVRKTSLKTTLAYKHTFANTAEGTREIEVGIDSFDQAAKFLLAIGLVEGRLVQKRRHSWSSGDITIDIDTYPGVPAFLEIEGPSEKLLMDAAQELGLPWEKVEMRVPRVVLKDHYKIPLDDLKYFTFDRIE